MMPFALRKKIYQENEKTGHRLEESICKEHLFVIQNIERTLKTKMKRKKKPNQ